MRNLVYALFLDMTIPQRYGKSELNMMLELWLKHLRGPGGWDGDIMLISNRSNFTYQGVEIVPINSKFNSIPYVQIVRVINHELIPSEEYDSILYLDLDILAVNDIHTLFAQDENIWVSPSNIPTLSKVHAWPLLGIADKIRYGLISPRRNQLGVSSCVFSTTSERWTDYMQVWAKLITDSLKKRPIAPSAEQSYLNFAYAKKLIPMKIFSRSKILHHSWTMEGSPILWHFPACQNRSNVMIEHSRLEH